MLRLLGCVHHLKYTYKFHLSLVCEGVKIIFKSCVWVIIRWPGKLVWPQQYYWTFVMKRELGKYHSVEAESRRAFGDLPGILPEWRTHWPWSPLEEVKKEKLTDGLIFCSLGGLWTNYMKLFMVHLWIILAHFWQKKTFWIHNILQNS